MVRLLNTYSGVAVVFFHNFRQSAMRITSGKQFFASLKVLLLCINSRFDISKRVTDAAVG